MLGTLVTVFSFVTPSFASPAFLVPVEDPRPEAPVVRRAAPPRASPEGTRSINPPAPAPAPAPRTAAPVARPSTSTPAAPGARAAKPSIDTAPLIAAPAAPPRTAPAAAKAEAPPTKSRESRPPESTARTESEEPALPRCSGRTADVKRMVSKILNTNVFQLTWREQAEGSRASFRVLDSGGAVRIQMMTRDGTNVGTAPASFCVGTDQGRPALLVGLQRSSLSFGSTALGIIDYDDIVNQSLAQIGSPNQLPLIVTRGAAPGLIHIADGINRKHVDAQFGSDNIAR